MSKPDLYKMFAATKPTEFDAFVRDYHRDHPIEEVAVVEVVQPKRKKAKKVEETVPKQTTSTPVNEPEESSSEE